MLTSDQGRLYGYARLYVWSRVLTFITGDWFVLTVKVKPKERERERERERITLLLKGSRDGSQIILFYEIIIINSRRENFRYYVCKKSLSSGKHNLMNNASNFHLMLML